MPMRTMHRVNGLMFQDLLRYEEEAREMTDQKDVLAQDESDKFKLVYIKRWRTLFKVPASIADEVRDALNAEQSDLTQARDLVEDERRKIETEARRYAGMYPQSSDGRNTFVIFADWVAGLPHPSTVREADHG